MPVPRLRRGVIQESADAVLARLKEAVPEADTGAAKVRFTRAGATITAHTKFRVKGVQGELGGEFDWRLTGEITAAGYIDFRW